MTARRYSGALRAVAVMHPLPSAINATLVAALAVVAGGDVWVAVAVATAMLGFQVSIGALNDVVDVEADRRAKSTKPIPAGLISTRTAFLIAVVGAGVGLLVSASLGVAALVLGALGYGCGVAYDLVMRRLRLGWLCLAAALPIMLVWAWEAASGSLPPGWFLVLPLAALAGPALHLANSLVDEEGDRAAGRHSLATQLGRRRARLVLASLMAVIVSLAWGSLMVVVPTSGGHLVIGVLATLAVGLGVALSWRSAPRWRELGWLLQATGLALLAVAWLASVAMA